MVTPTEDYYPDHDGGQFAPILATVATWSAPAFLENLAIDAEGAVFVTVYSHKRVDRYDSATGATTTFAEVPAPPLGLAFDAGGVLWMTSGTLYEGPGYIGSCSTRISGNREEISMTTKPKILVVGATGTVGKAVLPHLIANPNVEPIAAARNPEKAANLGLPVVYLDLDKFETIEPALQGIDHAFLLTGYTIDMMQQSKDFLNAAKRAGVKHIVHLGACGDNDTRVPHYSWHQFIERYIEWCGFSFTHLRPEIFMQNLLGYGGVSAVQKGVIRHYIGKARWSWVDIEDIAEVAAACLLDPKKHNGQTYRLGYEAATFDDIAAIFTRVLGQPFSYEARPPEEFYRNVLAAGAEPSYMKCVFDTFAELANGTAVKPDEVFDNLPAIIGRKPKTLADFARKHADKFRY